MFQQGEIDSIGDRVALTQDPGDFARLPVDDARQDQVQAAAGVHLLPQLARVDPAAPPVKDVPGHASAAYNVVRQWHPHNSFTHEAAFWLSTYQEAIQTGIIEAPEDTKDEKSTSN